MTTPVIDAHCDSLHFPLDGKGSLVDGIPEAQVDLPKLRKGGIHVQIFACWVPRPYQRAGAAAYALRLIETFYREIERSQGRLFLIRTVEDLTRWGEEDAVGGILSLEGAEALEGFPETLGAFYRLGVRWLGLTWNYRNAVADGVAVARSRGGLTPFGEDVVRTCEDLGIVVDVSHLAPAGVEDVLALAKNPVVASHSNARALCDHPRNLTDEQIRAIAATGGVIGVTFVPEFLTTDTQNPTLEHVLDHIDHMVRLVGVDHVGIGSDFDGLGGNPPRGLENAAHYPALRRGLENRGFTSSDIEAIMGGNWLRVLRSVMGADKRRSKGK